AERQDAIVDAVRSEMPEHPLDHGHADNGKHLLGGREGQGAKPRPLPPNEDNCLHYLVVVVDEGFVVVVAAPVSSSSWFLEVVVEITQERACTMPTLPASGVPAGHFSPFVYSVALVDGYFSLV